MSFATLYVCYRQKLERKSRTQADLETLITWLTGFSSQKIQELIQEDVSIEVFFQRSHMHKDAHLITGVICGHRVEDIENPLMRQVRCLDKIVDELARGRTLDKIMRKK